jgi:hypothetical protein
MLLALDRWFVDLASNLALKQIDGFHLPHISA